METHEKNVDLGDLLVLAEQTDKRLDKLEVCAPVRLAVTLSSGGWSDDSGDADYPYQYRLTVKGVTDASIAHAGFDNTNRALAASAGLYNLIQTATDTVIFYAVTAPTSDLTGWLDVTYVPFTRSSS